MIELRAVHKVFNQDRPNEFRAIRGVDLTVEPGRVTVLKGPSGSGKTTLLTLVGCLARPTSGRVRLGDRDISGLSERFLTDIRRHTFGFVFQQFNLIRGMSVLDNVIVPALPTGRRYGDIKARASALLARFDLADKTAAEAEWLSGGEAQRVAVARSLVNDPQVVIADEPTANLDSPLSERFLAMVEDLKGEGRTILIASHDPLVCTAPVVDTVVEMRDGRVITGGSGDRRTP